MRACGCARLGLAKRSVSSLTESSMPAARKTRSRMKLSQLCPLTAATSSPATTYRMLSRSEEHTSELQSLMRISYAVFCLKTKKQKQHKEKKIKHTTTNKTYKHKDK